MSAPRTSSHRTITVKREGGWYAMFRRLKIMVDGNQMATLARREEITLILPPDAKLLWGAMDWAETHKIDLRNIVDGDTLVFRGKFTADEAANLGVKPMPFEITRL
ncbi:MAG: hypothetical protein AAFP99_03500 [Pseudomonadota bacterium]